jgi:Zn-dependent M28 family amino/carboxypeptidase
MQNSAAYLRTVVNRLADEIGARTFRDLDRLTKTADYISEQFTSFGYQVTKQPFLFNGNIYHNIIAELVGCSSPETILIVGAHYDSVYTTPGADDNASGVAGLLCLAQALAGCQVEKTVRFVAFALEEWPVYRSRNMASYHYAQSLHDKNERVAGMICLEMIGFYCDREGCQHYPFPFMKLAFPKTGNYIAMVGNRRSKLFTEQIAESFRKATELPLITLNAPAIVIGIDFSDHWSFNKFGYQALMVTDTAFYRNPHYHKPSDLPETLDYERMSEVVRGLTESIKEWGGVNCHAEGLY